MEWLYLYVWGVVVVYFAINGSRIKKIMSAWEIIMLVALWPMVVPSVMICRFFDKEIMDP